MSRSMVASMAILDGHGRTVLCGSTGSNPLPVGSKPKAPKDPKECAERRRVECERCLRYGGAPGRYEASCPFQMGEEEKK